MGSFTNYTENAILNEVFGGTAFTAPTTLYIGLSTTTVTETGGGITEPVGNNYSRVAVSNNLTNFPTTSTSTKQNGVAFNFPQASGNWGTVTYFFISDANSGGNIIAYDDLTIPKTVEANDILSFAINGITITLD